MSSVFLPGLTREPTSATAAPFQHHWDFPLQSCLLSLPITEGSAPSNIRDVPDAEMENAWHTYHSTPMPGLWQTSLIDHSTLPASLKKSLRNTLNQALQISSKINQRWQTEAYLLFLTWLMLCCVYLEYQHHLGNSSKERCPSGYFHTELAQYSLYLTARSQERSPSPKPLGLSAGRGARHDFLLQIRIGFGILLWPKQLIHLYSPADIVGILLHNKKEWSGWFRLHFNCTDIKNNSMTSFSQVFFMIPLKGHEYS